MVLQISSMIAQAAVFFNRKMKDVEKILIFYCRLPLFRIDNF